ncbi:MAG TPA: hypothetical protein PLN85_00065 [archaeon]|nr:hypothetical protein [archaeon]
MKFSKKEIFEIIDSDGELIGRKKIPTNGSDLESQANNTTDYNSRIGTQPYRYDMLGRFGFTLMPFMEGEDSDEKQDKLVNDLIELMQEKTFNVIKHYYKNPNKLKSDYRLFVNKKKYSNDIKEEEIWVNKIMKIFDDYLKNTVKPIKNIDEDYVKEDMMVDNKIDSDLTNKSTLSDIRDIKLKKVAGLINKLSQSDKNKLMKLLEFN